MNIIPTLLCVASVAASTALAQPAAQPAAQTGTQSPAESAAAPPSQLHRAITASPLVVVGRHVGVATHGEGLRLHRIKVLEVLKGARRGQPLEAITVVDLPQVSLHNRPATHQTRLYCVVEFATAAARAGLPEEKGPYYKLSGYPGSNPLVIGEPSAQAEVRFAEVLGDGLSERPLQESTDLLLDFVRSENHSLRSQAAQVLTHHRSLRGKVTEVTWSELMARAVGETDDVGYKIALAELCAVHGVPGLVEGLCLSVPSVADREFAMFLGRTASALLGDEGAQLLQARAQQSRRKDVRDRFLLALGATRGETALEALLRLNAAAPNDIGVTAALEAHGSSRAREATMRKKQ